MLDRPLSSDRDQGGDFTPHRRGGRGGRGYYSGGGGGYDRRRSYGEMDSASPGNYDRALSANRPSFGTPYRGRGRGGRGRGAPRLPGNVKERDTQIFVSAEVMLAKELITRLGDFRVDENNIAEAVGVMEESAALFASQGDLVNFEDDMSQLFVKSLTHLPLQGPLISTLLAMIAKQNNSFPRVVVSKIFASMKAAIATADIVSAKIILRNLSVLVASGALALEGRGSFSELVDALLTSVEANTGAQLSVVQQAATYLLASAAPWFAATLVHRQSGDKTLATRCLKAFRNVLENWKSPYDVNGPYAVFHDESIAVADAASAPSGMGCWDTLWESCRVAADIFDGEFAATIADMSTSSVDTVEGRHVHSSSFEYPKCFLRPWTMASELLSAPYAAAALLTEEGDAAPAPVVEDVVVEGGLLRFDVDAVQDLKSLLSSDALETTIKLSRNMQSASECKGMAAWLCARYQIFSADTNPKAAVCFQLSLFEKYFITDLFRDLFIFFQPYIRDDGTHIGTVELMASHMLASFKLFNYKETEPNLEFLLVETLLELLTQSPPLNPAGVQRLFLDLCKKDPLKIPPAIASVTGVLAQMLPAMDTSSVRTVAAWLSAHLDNTKLAWPYWDYWCNDYVNATKDAAHRNFINLILDHCTRSCSHKKMVSALPVSVHSAIPVDFVPASGDLLTSSDPLGAVARALKEKLEGKLEADDVLEWLEENHESLNDSLQPQMWRVSLLVKVLLILGASKTLSQLSSSFEKFGRGIRELSAEEGGQQAVLSAVVETVGHDLGFAEIVFNMLIRLRILSPVTVAEYVMSPAMISQLATNVHIYGLAELCINLSLDVVSKLVAQRKVILSRDIMDTEGPVAAAKDLSGAVTHIMAMGNGGGDAPKSSEENAGDDQEERRSDAEEDQDNDDENEGSGRNIRRRLNNGEKSEVVSAEAQPKSSEAELNTVNQALAIAVGECEKIYALVAVTLMTGLSKRFAELQSSGETDAATLDAWYLGAVSLFRRALHLFHSTNAKLAFDSAASSISIADAGAVASKVDFRALPPQVQAVWNHFSQF